MCSPSSIANWPRRWAIEQEVFALPAMTGSYETPDLFGGLTTPTSASSAWRAGGPLRHLSRRPARRRPTRVSLSRRSAAGATCGGARARARTHSKQPKARGRGETLGDFCHRLGAGGISWRNDVTAARPLAAFAPARTLVFMPSPFAIRQNRIHRSSDSCRRADRPPLARHVGKAGDRPGGDRGRGGGNCRWLFRYGAVVLFNVAPLEEADLLRQLQPLVQQPYAVTGTQNPLYIPHRRRDARRDVRCKVLTLADYAGRSWFQLVVPIVPQQEHGAGNVRSPRRAAASISSNRLL